MLQCSPRWFGHTSRWAFGPRDFEYVWQLPIPVFDPANPDHRRLVAYAAEAERVAQTAIVAEGTGFQTARKQIRVSLVEAGIGNLDDAEAHPSTTRHLAFRVARLPAVVDVDAIDPTEDAGTAASWAWIKT